MVGSGPHRAGSHQPEPARSQQQGNFPNPKRDRNEENGRFREGSVNTTQTSRNHSRVGSHVSQRQNNEQAMQREIKDLKRNCAMHNKGVLILTLTCPPMMKAMMTIGRDQEPLQVRPSLMKKSITRGTNADAHLLGAWNTMP